MLGRDKDTAVPARLSWIPHDETLTTDAVHQYLEIQACLFSLNRRLTEG